MDKFSSQCISLVSFGKIYSQNIRPKLEEIDIFLKSSTLPYAADDVAHVLAVTPADLLIAMSRLGISTIDKINFFSLLFVLPSYICTLIKRQWQYGSDTEYNAEMIAHIYQINLEKVKLAFDELNIQYINEDQINQIFERIPATIFTT